jgi:tRNA1Val (adenine37-N6)-methyltransferase
MFRFKQFTIHDEKCAHKVGTDGTLLGAWAAVDTAETVLDIGTGSGLIALMLAQRSLPHTIIDAVELSKIEYEQASENVARSPWPAKVVVHHSSLQEYNAIRNYDLIVSNPPYFINSYKPPETRRIATRHTDTLPFQDLLRAARQLLTPRGKLSVVLPFTEGLHFIELSRKYHFHVSRQCAFLTRREKPVERWLLEFVNHEVPVEKTELLLYAHDNEWSEEYKLLTKDFYLKPRLCI